MEYTISTKILEDPEVYSSINFKGSSFIKSYSLRFYNLGDVLILEDLDIYINAINNDTIKHKEVINTFKDKILILHAESFNSFLSKVAFNLQELLNLKAYCIETEYRNSSSGHYQKYYILYPKIDKEYKIFEREYDFDSISNCGLTIALNEYFETDNSFELIIANKDKDIDKSEFDRVNKFIINNIQIIIGEHDLEMEDDDDDYYDDEDDW
jgi:hypothetical protein